MYCGPKLSQYSESNSLSSICICPLVFHNCSKHVLILRVSPFHKVYKGILRNVRWVVEIYFWCCEIIVDISLEIEFLNNKFESSFLTSPPQKTFPTHGGEPEWHCCDLQTFLEFHTPVSATIGGIASGPAAEGWPTSHRCTSSKYSTICTDSWIPEDGHEDQGFSVGAHQSCIIFGDMGLAK